LTFAFADPSFFVGQEPHLVNLKVNNSRSKARR
jgi:hypothetical protein